MLRTPGIPTRATNERRTVPSLNPTHKIILVLLVAVLAAVPLWLGLERAHSAPAKAASRPLAMATPTPPLPPSVTLDVPDEVLIGDTFKFTVTFYPTNAVGYGPFIDLVLPAGGIDYNDLDPSTTNSGPCDGVTFVSGSAQMIGVNGGPIPLTTDVVSAPCNHTTAGACETLTHPYAANGISSVAFPNISVPEGAQLVTIKLPFGSFEPNQPPIVIQITAKLSDHADVNAPLNIYARAGFQFGTTPNNDFNTDPPANRLSPGGVTNCAVWTAAAQVTPVLFTFRVEDRLSATPGPCYDGLDNGSNNLTDSKDPDCQHAKTYIGPEDETATGPNYPRQYKIILDVAAGQTITNLTVQDCLPNNVVFTGIGTGTSPTPIPSPAAQSAAQNNNCVSFNYPTITGTTSTTDVVIFVNFYVPQNDANGNPVLDPAVCSNAASPNDVKASVAAGNWAPVDHRDSSVAVTSDVATVDHLLTDKHLAVQKSVKVMGNPNGPIPGDTLQYTLDFQVSDFFTIGNLEIDDFLSDGQLLTGPPPTLIVKDGFGTSSGHFTNSNLLATPNKKACCRFLTPTPGSDCTIRGGTDITFNISSALATFGSNPRQLAGILTGGHAFSPNPNTPATGQIVFYAKIQDTFAYPHPGDQFVDKDDPLTDCAIVTGEIFKNAKPLMVPVTTGAKCEDDSHTAISIVTDTIKKTVYAVKRNGNFICGPSGGPCSNSQSAPQEVRPGDDVTFEIEKTIPSGDAEQLSVEDWLPLPIFDVTGASFLGTHCGIPGPNVSCLGPSDQMQTLTPPVSPSFAVTPTNGITFDYSPNFNYPANHPRTIDLLFTSTVTNQPFADGLYLTNEAQECESNTFGVRFCQAAIAQVNLREPKLVIRKGVIATSNTHGSFSHQPNPATGTLAQAPTGVTFSPGGVGGLVKSTDLAAGYFDSDLSNVDANDLVTYAITIENVGGAPAFDAKMEDIIPNTSGTPTCFTIVPGSIKVQRGTGVPVNPLLYQLVFPTVTGGFTVTSNPLPIPIAAANPTNGANIVVITFQARILANIMPGCCDNRAKLLHYSSVLNGPDFVSAGFTPPFEDPAKVCVNPTLTKTLRATSEPHTAGSNVAIGEIARYRLETLVPEGGLLPNFQVTDALPAGMKFLPGTARLAFISNGPGIAHPFAPVSGIAFNVIGNETTLPFLGFNSAQTVTPTGGTTCGGGPLTFNLGNVQNNDNDNDLEYIVIEFNALVCNEAGNQSGTTLPNTFGVSVGGNQIAASNPINVIIVEPNLTMTKSVAPNPAIKGQTLTYAVQYTNNGTADAFDVVLQDTLPSGLTLGTITAGCPFTSVGNVLTMTCAQVPKAPGSGSTVIVTYQAVANPATCPVTLNNQANLTWTSLPGLQGTTVNPTGSSTPGNSGAVDGERNGVTPLLTLNDYSTTASAAVKIDCPCEATITGLKFNDLNGNGVRDTGEPGLANWTIQVTDSNGITHTTTTDSAGNYSLTIPAPGTYSVAEVLQSGWTQTAPTSGTYSVTVSPGQVVNNRDFGNKNGNGPSACAIPPAGMVAWWPMNETASATSLQDIIGGNNATPFASPVGAAQGPQPVSGKVGGAIQFPKFGNGLSGARVSPQGTLATIGAADFTIDAWVQVPPAPANRLHYIVNKFDSAQNRGYALYVVSPGVGGNERLEFKWGDGTNVSTVQTISNLTTGQWHHLAATFARNVGGSALDIRLYVDGAQQGQQTGNPPGLGSLVNFVFLEIGWQPGTIDEPITIDELEIFNRVLLQSEIDRIYRAGSAGKCRCLLASNEKISCNTNGTFGYTLTVTNLSSSTVSNLVFSPGTSNVTITPASMTIPPLGPGGSTNVTVTISGPDAVSGAKVCFFVGLGGSIFTNTPGCRTEHCITLPTCPAACQFVAGLAGNFSTIPTFDFGTGTTTAQFVTGASDDRGRGVEVVSGLACWNTTVVYYTSISGDIHVAPYAGGSGGPDITVLPNPRQGGNGIQDLDYANGILYAMTGYNQGNGAVPIVYSLNPCTGAILSSVNLVSSSRNSDGFTVLPSGDFLINDGDGSTTYRAYSSTTGAPTGLVITLPASSATGVDYNPPDNSLYFFANFVGTRKLARTDLSGNLLGTVPVAWTGSFIEDISVLPCAPSLTGSLAVTKTVKNLWAIPFPAGTNFPITVSCLPSGPNVTFNLAAGGTQTVNNIPVGSTCTVTEGALPPPLPHPACPSLEWGTPVYVPGQTVTIPSTGGSQTVTVTNTYFCNTTPGCATPPPGMVAWWPLDETSGNVVHSIVGNHDGITQSGPIGTGGPSVASAPKVGSALFFGVNKAEVSDDPALNFGTGDFSIDAWVRSYQSTLLSAIVDKLDTSTTTHRGYAFFVQNGMVQLRIGDGVNTATYQSSNTFVADGTWRHVAVTMRRAGGTPVGQFYIDGVPAGGSFTPLAINLDNSAKLLVGSFRLGNNACSCEVSLDEIEMFNTAVQPADIKSIFQADKKGKCKATITGSKYNDLNGNGVRNTGEPGLANWTIKVTDSSGNAQTTTTDSAGNYSFTVPGSGTYTVSEVLQSGWTQTAPTSGTYSVTVSPSQTVNSRDFGNKKQCAAITLNPAAGALPAPGINTPYSQTFTATGGCAQSFTYSLTSGALPLGFSLGADGMLSGTATQPGDFTFTVTATDSCGCSQSQTYTLKVNCPTVPLRLFNTGVADNGSLLASGATDPHYVLLNTSPVFPNAFVLSANQIVGYLPNSATSQWLGPDPPGANGGQGGFYTYRTTFNLDCDPSTAVISGQWATDNEAEIFLNGSPTGVTTGPGDFLAFKPFVIASGFISGVNTLDFRVRNRLSSQGARTATGMQVQMNGTVKCCSATGSLTVTKTVENLSPSPIPAGTTFRVTVSCSTSGPNVTLNLAAGGTQTLNNIPVGSKCTMTEAPLPAPPSSPVCPSLQWAAPTYSPGQSVTILNSGAPQTVTIQNRLVCMGRPPVDTYTFTRGMNEFCIWGGGGSFYSPTRIDNPNSPFLTGNNPPPLNTGGVRYGTIGLCYGRILLANDKVAFKYTFNAIPVAGLSYPEVNPVFIDRPGPFPVSATRRNVFGGGLSPIGLQLYFRPQKRIKPFVNADGGFIFFKDQVPRLNGARFNFTYDVGGGVQVFRDANRAFTFGYKYQNISNGGRALNNPGFYGNVFYLGYSIFNGHKIDQSRYESEPIATPNVFSGGPNPVPLAVHNVGIIPDASGGCPAGSDRIIISMDDEDKPNTSSVNGWTGAISHYSTGTHFEFCRVDGNQFGSHPGGDYAVLKLSETCPDGSVSVSRIFDNENNKNKNWSSGAGVIYPNKSEKNTLLYFCYFASPRMNMPSFPSLGVPYGVFAAPSPAWLATGTVFTDDEDNGNADETDGSPAPLSVGLRFVRIIYGSGDDPFRGKNTYLLVAKVSN